jgi:frataxin
MDANDFDAAADTLLARLQTRIENELADADIDAELRGGILTVEFDDGRQFVINKHGPTKQIWVSSPLTGAAHYAWDEGAKLWRSTRSDATLEVALAADLEAASGLKVAF